MNPCKLCGSEPAVTGPFEGSPQDAPRMTIVIECKSYYKDLEGDSQLPRHSYAKTEFSNNRGSFPSSEQMFSEAIKNWNYYNPLRPAALEPLYAWIVQGHEAVEVLRVVGNAELGQASQRDRLTL